MSQSTSDRDKNQFGTFDGVFTPCVLTILGVIMFLRFGYVVGQAGIWYAFLIVSLSKAITLLTSLSLSAIATNTRVRLLDGIPFTKKIRMDMEVWHWAPVEVAYAATTQWYALPGAKANYAPMPDLACVLEAKGPKPRKVEGAIEGLSDPER